MTAEPGCRAASRLARVDWSLVNAELDAGGFSMVPRVLTSRECESLRSGYDRDRSYRSTVDMERYRFGRGEYRYFNYPLPGLVEELRQGFYTRLYGVANEWQKRLARQATFPARLDEFLERCRGAGQSRPTPLILRYNTGDYNRLHQDLYGAVAFPLQVVVNLSEPGRDYSGGELILVEQKPRSQSRATALTPALGDAVIFTNRERPVTGSRGAYRVQMRHGASTVTRGSRFALGLIFHDAE
jgi:hypothetical protein